MPEPVWTVIAVVVSSGLTYLLARPKSKAETTQIVDEIARGWIEELRSEVGRLRAELSRVKQQHAAVDRAYLQHIGVLEAHINDQLPPPPPARPTFDH